MRFLFDENVDLRLLTFLTNLGHDVSSVVSRPPRGRPDGMVLALAAEEGRILLTNDRDFGELVFRQQLPHSGVLLLRLKDESLKNVQNRLEYTLIHHKDDLCHFVVITQKSVRVRKVPGKDLL
jgi:predicted nuclease of predicted toxin-antitoxin system